MIRSLWTKAIALAMLGALVLASWHFPVNKPLLAAALGAVIALLCWRPHWWLLLVPALLPVLDLAPWTGWFFLDELDLLLLASAAVGYWRLGAAPPQARLPTFFMLALGLFSCSFALAAVIGMAPFPPFDANAFSNYNSPYNSLRVAKGLAWALVLLPLLRRSAGPDLQGLQRYFVPGMLLGLTFTALAVVWERATFPGLLDFASDYRPTAPFSAMHTGGAALDAYLAISFPFVVLWLAPAGQVRRLGLALAILLLGAYAGLTTFSRDMYIAFGSSAAILIVLGLAHRLQRGAIDRRALLANAVLLVLLTWLLIQVFGSSGYRGLLAALVLLGSAAILAASAVPVRPGLAGAVGLLALLAVLGVAFLVPKGAYIAFALAAALFGAGALQLAWPARQHTGMALAAGAFPALMLASVLVARHWGGATALPDALVLAGVSGAMIVLNRRLARPLWRIERNTMTTGALCAIVFALVIPIAGSYHTGTRFATVSADIDVRLAHWNEALAMMTPDLSTSLFGMGLGRYPDTFFWKNTHGETPGSYSYVLESPGNQVLRLGTAQYARGYGEALRMLQHVAVRPGQRYRLALDIRRTDPEVKFSVMVCERWLLYPKNCAQPPLKLQAADGAWHHYEVEIASQGLGQGTLLRAPTQLEMATYGRAGFLDVDNVSLVPLGGSANLVENGSFSAANDNWFFSSDRNHFPWHVKNFPINTYFETGWLGLGAIAMLIVYLAGLLTMRALHGELEAGVALAALSGFLLVGLFDSLFDVPRLTLVFFLVACSACMLPAKAVRQRRRVRRDSQVAEAAAESVA